MDQLKRLAGKLPNYVRAFGWRNGVRLLLSIEGPLPGDTVEARAYRVPGYSGPIHLRTTLSDHATFWQCIVRNQYDISSFAHSARLMGRYRAAVAQGRQPLIVDCGGNVGLSVVGFARQFPQALIYVIEPDDANVAMLLRNVEPYRDRVKVLHGGIWSRSCHLRIRNPGAGAAALQVEEAPASDPAALRAYTIDEVCEMAGDPSPFIVKMDIEGAQAELFCGDVTWVDRTELIMLELDDWQFPWQGSSRPFFAALAGRPFEYLFSGETLFCFRDMGATT